MTDLIELRKLEAKLAAAEKQRDDLLVALQKAANAAHSVLIASEYGDDLGNYKLRKLLVDSRDESYAVISAMKLSPGDTAEGE